MIQHMTFTNGSFVLHKVVIGKCKYSAWFNRLGSLVDAERFDSIGRVSTVSPKHHRKVWEALHKIGQRYVKPV